MALPEMEDVTKKDSAIFALAVAMPFFMITLDHLIIPYELVSQKYLFNDLADIPTVPLPKNGSKTKSPGYEYSFINLDDRTPGKGHR